MTELENPLKLVWEMVVELWQAFTGTLPQGMNMVVRQRNTERTEDNKDCNNNSDNDNKSLKTLRHGDVGRNSPSRKSQEGKHE
jgi:hypothetical protein